MLRLNVVFVLIFFIGGGLLFRLFEKQVVEHRQYAQAAQAQSIGETAIQAQRGRIFAKDRDGQLFPLAVSEWRYQLLVSPRQVKDKARLADELAKAVPLLERESIYQAINNDKVYIPPLIKGLEGTLAKAISEEGYAGVFLLPQLVRVYPEGEDLAAQVLGFVGADGEGKYGVEAVYDKLLRGITGSQRAKRDSLGRLIDILGGKASETGADVVLTVDHNLQYIVETKLKEALQKYQASSGSIVVMNPKNGAILALSGQPTFDPNSFSKLRGDEQARFLAPAASSVYEPGSVFKPLTMAMALDAGLVSPETTENFGAEVQVLDKLITNAEGKVFGRQTMRQVLENSDNVAMVWVADKVGNDLQRQYLEKFGFGQKSEIDLVGEQAGHLPELKDWNDLLRATAGFGQGVSANVVQLAAAYSVLANGGILKSPHLAEKTLLDSSAQAIDFPDKGAVLKSETAAAVREMLVGVVENGHGKRARVSGVRIGGKTGTAQVANPAGGYFEDRHIGTFAGLFPADDPRFVMVVRLDNPKTVRFAESSAAPTFGEIAGWMTNYYGLR